MEANDQAIGARERDSARFLAVEIVQEKLALNIPRIWNRMPVRYSGWYGRTKAVNL